MRNVIASMPFIEKIKHGVVRYLICSNGAIIYDLETKTLIYNKPLVENEIKEIFEIAKD